MLSAGRVLKSIGLQRQLFTGVRSLALGLNEQPAYPKESISRYKRQLKNELEQLESNTRRFGRIDPLLFGRCLQTIRNEQLTTKESLILLKCCGPLMYNRKKEARIEYIDQLWSILKEKKIPFDIMHYNLLIKMYTVNGHQFEPMDLVNEMQSVGIAPNHRTYEFIVNKYCLDGDLEKVTKILERMNEEGQSLTAPMFDSLILAYFLNKNIAQALEMFEMMKESAIAITGSTYQNLIIGHLKNYDPDSTLDSIKQLISEHSIRFDITEITSIIEQIGSDVPREQADELKHLLIGDLRESSGFFNELSNCCYTLILKNEHDIVKMLYDKYFVEEQSRYFFIKRLATAVLKSDEPKITDFMLFLKKLFPMFNFSNFIKGTVLSEDFDLKKSLQVLNELEPTLDKAELGVYVYLVDKCTNMKQLHSVTERYLRNLDPSWITHIKRYFIPSLQGCDLFEFVEEHLKKYRSEKNRLLLQTAIFCHYLDQMEIDRLSAFCDKFEPDICLCTHEYLLTRAEGVLHSRESDFATFAKCIAPKIFGNHSFNADFVKFCSDRLSDQKLEAVLQVYNELGLPVNTNKLDEQEVQRLQSVGSHVFKSDFEKFFDKLVKGDQIVIDQQLEQFRNTSSNAELNNIFLAAVRHRNYQVASFFLYPQFLFGKGTLIKYLHLMLKEGEDPERAIRFFERHFDDRDLKMLEQLHPEIDEIFECIKHDENLVYRFTDKVSMLVSPEALIKHLIKFYSETHSERIGRTLIELNFYLKSRLGMSPTFSTMVAFIEARNTALLQEFSNKLLRKTDLEKSEVFDRLTVAFVYAKRFKQAIKVIETGEFKVNEHNLVPLFDHLSSIGRKEVIKQFSILVYQNSPNSKTRGTLLQFLNKYAASRKDSKLFEEILTEIKKLSGSAAQRPAYKAEARSVSSKQPAASTKVQATADETIDLTQRFDSKQKIIELADERIAKKKELKINVECDLIDKLVQFGELDKATEIVYDMLVNERYPAPQVIKHFYKALNLNAKLASIERLDPYVPKQLKESEFYRSNKVITSLRATDSDEEIIKCLQSVEIFSLDLIDQALRIKPDYEQQIVDLLKAKKKSNLCFVWLHFMQAAKYEKALNLVVNSGGDLNARNLLFQPIVNTAKQTGNLVLAKELVDYAAKFDLRTDTVQSIYGAYIKLCLAAGKVGEAEQAVRDHYRSKPNIQLNLKTLNQELLAKFDKAFLSEFVHK